MVLMEALEDEFLSAAASLPNTFDTGLAFFLPASSLPWALRFVVAKGPSTVESGAGYLVQSNRDPQGFNWPKCSVLFWSAFNSEAQKNIFGSGTTFQLS